MTDTARPPTGDDGPHMRRCSRCRRVFGSRAGVAAHIAAVHKGRGERVSVHRDREPSLASEVVKAQIARASGEPVDPYIAEMFDV